MQRSYALTGLSDITQYKVRVIDQSGRTVYHGNATDRLMVDVSQLAKGAYFVRVTDSQSSVIRKLVVK